METFRAGSACPFVDPDKLFEENMNFEILPLTFVSCLTIIITLH